PHSGNYRGRIHCIKISFNRLKRADYYFSFFPILKTGFNITKKLSRIGKRLCPEEFFIHSIKIISKH
ncbi:hypothetical protein DX903_11825, partial [Adlercreutzia equolifaciens]